MKLTTAFVTGIAAAALTFGATLALAPASSAAICNDGWTSMSSSRGTCSWHGGVMGGGSSRNNGGYDPFGYSSPKRGGNSYGYGYGNDSYGFGSGGSKYNSKRYGW
jgi:hypothetical protein